MKHEPSTQAHPSHSAHAGQRMARTNGHRNQPSSAFDSNDRSNETDGFSSATLWRRLPLSVGIVLALCPVLIAVCAAVCLRVPDPAALVTPLAWGAVGFASLIGGVIAGRRTPTSPVAAGLLCGLAVVLVITLAGFLVGKCTPSGWILRVCIPPLHLIGALLSRPKVKPAAHRDHHADDHHRH